MLENGGHIVSMCSIAGVAPATYMVPYSASKHAIRYSNIRQDVSFS